MKKLILDSIIVGMALFAMFFGAGNIIFPPYIGLGAGVEWVSGFIPYFIADVGLALVAIVALIRADCSDRPEGLMYPLGKKAATLLMGIIVLCIGPLIAIPRTAATTFQIGIAPFFGDDQWIMILFSILFFLVVFAFSVKESKMVDIVGKYLTPIKFLGLLTIIIGGVIWQIGPINETVRIDNIVRTGIIAGYQTLDVLAALIFGVIIINTLKEKGHNTREKTILSVGLASIIAAVLLFIIYGGLCFLGATVSSIYPMDIDRGTLVVVITQSIFGIYSSLILAVVITVSCLATAIALTSASGTYFSKALGGPFTYLRIVIGVCIFSAIGANFGLTAIINFAAPILNILYPGALVVVFLSLFGKDVIPKMVMRFATAGAIGFSFFVVFEELGLPFTFVRLFPLYDLGFAWIIPACLCGAIGYFFVHKKENSQETF